MFIKDRKDIKKLFQQSSEFLNQTITICGWVRSRRDSKSISFVVLNDGSCQESLQIIIDREKISETNLQKLQTGAAAKFSGKIVPVQGREQGIEMQAEHLEVVGESGADYPLQKKGHTLEFLREISHLRPRTNTYGAVFRIRNRLSFGIHEFFQSRGFQWAHTPIITASDCEGAGQMFQVTTFNIEEIAKKGLKVIDYSDDFFGQKVHLTVSGQLQGEMLAMAYDRIYTFGPTFRAENSNTTRHLAEFWMVEPEIAFADLEDDMILAEDMFRYLCKVALKDCQSDLEFLDKQYKTTQMTDLEKLSKEPFARVSYTEAVDILLDAKKNGQTFEFPVSWGTDLQSEHERFLTDQVFKKAVIVYNYPKEIKAFYMKQNDDGKTVAAMDVLAPRIGEIIGGSQREDDASKLETRMREVGIDPGPMQWYLDLRRYGGTPHAGFGLGFERLVQYLTGMTNIRDTIVCPRAPKLIGI